MKEQERKAKDSTYWSNWWQVYGLGQIGSLDGVCITDWKEINQLPEEARLLCGGMDFGYQNDPSTYIRLYKYIILPAFGFTITDQCACSDGIFRLSYEC